MKRIRIAACQVNPVVGDLSGNVARAREALGRAEAAGCDVAILPELAITGYPPEDLLLKPRFVADNRQSLEELASSTGRCAAVVGFVDADRDLYNAAAVCAGGEVRGIYQKRHLPNYAVFDEQRYFVPGRRPYQLYVIAGVRVAVSVCEDAWSPTGPVSEQAAGGAELVLNINASPYSAGRIHHRERMLATRAADASCALVYVNQVGGQDELVFDGGTLVFDHDGRVVGRGEQFAEGLTIFDLAVRPVFRKRLLDPRGRSHHDPLPEVVVSDRSQAAEREARPPQVAAPLDRLGEVYNALTTGTRDYVAKNGFTDAVIALSGGIDSGLVACIATDALGPERVHGVSLPSRYSSGHSKDDAKALAHNLGIDYRAIAIEPAHAALLGMLEPEFEGREPDQTEENLQARVRGVVLMALSNKFPQWLALTTGNKSELAVGYATLYGDMAGGFAVIKDVPKLLVYELARWRNDQARRRGEVPPLPDDVLTKPPSAELRPDQRDEDSLPAYEVLDPLLADYIERDLTAAELVDAGHDPELVERIVRLVDHAEYKRRQAAPGVRITEKAFGKDRRLPVTNHYRG